MTSIHDRRYGTVTADRWLDQLERQGKLSRGQAPLPEWFFSEPRPQPVEGSAVEQLMADRQKYDW